MEGSNHACAMPVHCSDTQPQTLTDESQVPFLTKDPYFSGVT